VAELSAICATVAQRIAAAPSLLTLAEIGELAAAHRRDSFRLTSQRGTVATLDGAVEPPDDAHAFVSELIRLAAFGALVREEALRAPRKRVSTVVNDVTSKLRRS
jgi:hypothetical protein